MRARCNVTTGGRLAPIALCLMALPALAQSAVQQSDLAQQHEAEVRDRYEAASWPRGELRSGLANELGLTGWTSEGLQSDQGYLTRSFRRPDAAVASFVLETHVTDTVDAAQAQLVTWLAGLQSTARMPAARELGLEVGDVGFVGRSGAAPRAISWIAFTRGNVAVRVSAFDPRREPNLELGPVARSVDRAILAAEPLAAGAQVPRPEVAMFVSERSSVVAGEKLRLDLTVVDPAGGEPHLQWTVGGPGQGYVERGEDGAHYLHTTGPGAITLTLEVTGSTGTFAKRAMEIAVADD